MAENNKKRIEKIRQKLKELEHKNTPLHSTPFSASDFLLKSLSSQKSTLSSPTPLMYSFPNSFETNNKINYNSHKLHEQAVEKKQKEVETEIQIIKQSIKIANEKKLTTESLIILENAVNKNITKAILNVDPNLSKVIDFNQVRQVLVRLALLDSPVSLTSKKENQKKEPIPFDTNSNLHFLIHSLIFNLKIQNPNKMKTSFSEIAKETIQADDLYVVLSTFLSPKLKPEEQLHAIVGFFNSTFSKDKNPSV